MKWEGVPEDYRLSIEGHSKAVENVMLVEAKKWHDVGGEELIKGELIEECCGYWHTFALKGGIAPHPISGDDDFRWVCGQIGKATSWMQRVRQVIEEKTWIPIHSVARESVLVVKEEGVGWVRLQLSLINQWSGERVE